MGGTTPRFGIRFPYEGEVVIPVHFKNFADDVNAAITTVTSLRNQSLTMPSARVHGPNSTGGATLVNAGTPAVLALGGGTGGSAVEWDNDGMWNPAQTDRLTVQTNGVYAITALIPTNGFNATTLNSFDLQIYINSGAKVISHKQNTRGMLSPQSWANFAVYPLTAGQIVQVRGNFFGSGQLRPATVTLAMQCICLS